MKMGVVDRRARRLDEWLTTWLGKPGLARLTDLDYSKPAQLAQFAKHIVDVCSALHAEATAHEQYVSSLAKRSLDAAVVAAAQLEQGRLEAWDDLFYGTGCLTMSLTRLTQGDKVLKEKVAERLLNALSSWR